MIDLRVRLAFALAAFVACAGAAVALYLARADVGAAVFGGIAGTLALLLGDLLRAQKERGRRSDPPTAPNEEPPT